MFDRFATNPDRFNVCESTGRSYATSRKIVKAATRRASRRIGAPRAIAEGLMTLGEEAPVVAALFAWDEDGWSVRGFSTVSEARSALRWFHGSDVTLRLVEFDEPQAGWYDWETLWTGEQHGEAQLVGALLAEPGVTLSEVVIGPSEGHDDDPWVRIHLDGSERIRRRAWEEAANDRYLWPYRVRAWLRANP